MSLTDCLKAWRDYLITLSERAYNDQEHFMKYKAQNLAYKIGEGLAFGGIGYYLADEPLMFVLGPIASVVGRNIQLKVHVSKQMNQNK